MRTVIRKNSLLPDGQQQRWWCEPLMSYIDKSATACLQVLEAEAAALLEQLRGRGERGWSTLKRGLAAAWGKPPTPRHPPIRQVREPLQNKVRNDSKRAA